MKIHVLSYARHGHATTSDLELLTSAAKTQGHELEVIYARECQMQFTQKPQILVHGEKPEDINILLVRANFLSGSLDFHAGLIKQFEMSGVPVINKHLPVLRAKNKLRTLQTFSKHDIPMPKTYILRSPDHLDDIVNDIGKYPVIIKTIAGSHGQGVSIVESKRGLKSIVQMMVRDNMSAPLVVQEYIKESKGKDIRIFIMNKRILGAMERIASKGEFRSNYQLGGKVRVAQLSEEEKEVAFKATKVCGLDIAGVDILRTKKGPKVLEVNSNPGLAGITQATERDIAGEIIKYAVKRAKRNQKRKKV